MSCTSVLARRGPLALLALLAAAALGGIGAYDPVLDCVHARLLSGRALPPALAPPLLPLAPCPRALRLVVLGYALVNGLGHKIVEVIKAPIETKIIDEVKPPPPPPPENLPPPPKMALPPPSFVPPPEVQIACKAWASRCWRWSPAPMPMCNG